MPGRSGDVFAQGVLQHFAAFLGAGILEWNRRTDVLPEAFAHGGPEIVLIVCT